jgi:hypothetical protein
MMFEALDTKGAGRVESSAAYRALGNEGQRKQAEAVMSAIRAMTASGQRYVHYREVHAHMAAHGGDIAPHVVCARMGELIAANRLAVATGIKHATWRGRMCSLQAQQTMINEGMR